MSSHDEYSSDEDDVPESTSTNVFLGFVDIGVGEDGEYPTMEDSVIGGQPMWLHPKSQPKKEDLTCDNCGQLMALLLQAFAPLDNKPYDRAIYLFACKNTRRCSRAKGSVKVIRGVNKDPARVEAILKEQQDEAQKLLDEKLRLEDKKKMQIEMTKDLFDTTKPASSTSNNSNPFSSGGNPFGSSNPFSASENPFSQSSTPKATAENKTQASQKQSYADVSRKHKQEEAKPETNELDLPEYTGYILFTEKEKLKKVSLEPDLEKYKHLIETEESTGPNEGSSKKNNKKERSNSSSSTSSGSGAVNAQMKQITNMLNDKYFENFSSVVNNNPDQVLRYDLGGSPLLYSGKEEMAQKLVQGLVPDPSYNPSSHRRFEMQLMPRAIMELEKGASSASDIINGMSWGTILIYTDEEDYMPQLDERHVGYVREYCAVQWEESVNSAA